MCSSDLVKAETMTVALRESEVKAETMTVALRESEVKAETMTVALRESEVKAETMTVALRESEMKAETITVALREREIEISTLISSQVEIESGNCSLIEEHVAMIAYLQNELELLQLSINSSSKTESLISAEPSTMTSSVSNLKVEVDILSHSQYGSRKKDDESENQRDALFPPLSKEPGLLSGTNDRNISGVSREFSHVQSEMSRFRSARDEAKVSLSKMAGRVAIVKDQLHEKVR